MLAQADRLGAALGPPRMSRPCHNDLLLANFIDDGARLWIIDWEYAAMGDVWFDLGNFAMHHQRSDDEERVLLEAYVGCVAPRGDRLGVGGFQQGLDLPPRGRDQLADDESSAARAHGSPG